MSGAVIHTGATPASLLYLAIYNPSLSNDDESLQDQILYFYSQNDQSRKSRGLAVEAEAEQSREELNERLRHIGLAQGMVEFAKCFFLVPAGSGERTELMK